MTANVRRGWAAVLAIMLTCALLVETRRAAAADTVTGSLGTLAVDSTVNVIGDRCGSLNYSWDGTNSDLPWTSSDWTVYLYGGAPTATPYEIGASAIDSVHGTYPWIQGIDDFPSMAGSLEICDKADSSRYLSVWGQWFRSGSGGVGQGQQGVPFTVDFHPVTVKVKVRERVVIVRVLMDGQPLDRTRVYVDNVRDAGVLATLKTNERGIARLKRTPMTRGHRVKFTVIDIAQSKAIRI